MDTLPVPAPQHPLERGAAPYSPYGDTREPTLRGLGVALLRHRLLLFLSILITVGLGVAYTFWVRPVYEATSVVRFEVERLDLPQLVQLVYSENLISTEMEVLRGRSAAEAVIDSLGLRARLVTPRRGRISRLFSVLRVSPTADTGTLVLHARGKGAFTISRAGSIRSIAVARIGDTTRVAGVMLGLAPAALDVPELRLRVDLLDDAIRRFESALSVSRPARDADLIAIRTRAPDPAQAAAMANLLARNLVAERQEVRRGRTGVAVAFLTQQDDSLSRQLHAAEDSLRAYQERARVVDVPEQARVQVGRLAQLQADIAGVRAERDAFATLVGQLRRADSTGYSLGGQAPSRRLMAFPSLLRNQSASVLLGALAQVETERSQLLIRRMPMDSDVQVLTGRIREIEAQLQGIAESYLQSLTNQVASLEGEAGRFGAQLNALPEKELQVARRERDTRVLSDLSVLVQTRLKEAQITGAALDPTVRVADAAAPPLRPVRPKLLVNLALTLVLGMLLGVMASLAREHGDRTVRSRADALAVGGLPVLGAIPRVNHRGSGALPWRRRQARDRAIASLLVTGRGTTPAYIESFNQLFANLALAYRQRPMKVVVFTSPLPGEGKTLSAINFALTGASRGLRILLIDADLRCGVVSSVLKCSRTPGFAELLGGTARLADALRRVDVGQAESLGVVPSGALQKTPGRVLTIKKVQEILGALARPVDFVVIDTPPVNLLADAALLGSAADAVLLVVRAGHTQADDLRYAMDQLEAAHAPVLGTLLNDIDLRRHASYDGAYRYVAQAKRYYVGAG